MTVRTRFAPSPTGYMHIGNLRTALYAYLFARKNGGKLVLRIEDTDMKRYVPQAIHVIYRSLELAGIDYDEGPDKDGGFGPYVQSQRRAIYARCAAEAVEKGVAFRCFCQQEPGKGGRGEGETRRRRVSRRGVERRDPCRYLTPEQVQEKIEQGEAYVIRQRIPEVGSTTFRDLVFGEITVDNGTLDDQVLLKSDGLPTYNFANVVDDHLMGITYVIRGLEYLSSTPKYNLLYSGLGWEIPEYIHLPHIIKENGRKLSKREGDASFEDLLDKGYLPEAVINYIALLGWSPGDDHEFFTLPELVTAFDLRHINKARAGFSPAKLDWINGEHVRALQPEEFHQRARPFYPAEALEKIDVEKVSRLIQPRVVKLSDIPGMIDFLLYLPEYDLALFGHEKSKSTLVSSRDVLEKVIPLLEGIGEWSNAALVEVLKSFAIRSGLKTGTVMWPVRVAVSGLGMTPGGATEIAEILGKDETLRRLRAAVERL